MPTLSVEVQVGEIVDGFETVIEEIKTRYLAHVVLGLLALLTAIVLASFCGALCALFCFNSRCHRHEKRRTKKTAV